MLTPTLYPRLQFGRLYELSNNMVESAAHYQRALALETYHAGALRGLAGLHYANGEHTQALLLLRQAVQTDASDYRAQYALGVTLRTLKQDAAAADALLRSVELEAIAPVLPFSLLPLSAGWDE